MSRITVEQKICLEPKFLDAKLLSHIYTTLKQRFVGKCDQELGYILKIYDNITVLGNTVSSAGSGIFFNTRFDIKTLKPKEGCVYEGNVCLVFSEGIFVEVANKMKILIHVDKMNGYKYSKTKNIFKKGTKTIMIGDKLEITIEKVKYEKQNFNCLGSLKTL
jgi:DNA-directed RNA polymerase subunit E'/Rpb7